MDDAEKMRSKKSFGVGAESIGAEHQFVGFTIDGQEFGVEIDQIREIVREMKMAKLPNSPEFVEGVVNLRGKVMPIIDLRKKFGIQAKKPDKDTRIIVTETSGTMTGFMTDSVTEVRRVNEASIEPPPGGTMSKATSYVSGLARLEESLLILLDLRRVLSSQEVETLTQIAQ